MVRWWCCGAYWDRISAWEAGLFAAAWVFAVVCGCFQPFGVDLDLWPSVQSFVVSSLVFVAAFSSCMLLCYICRVKSPM